MGEADVVLAVGAHLNRFTVAHGSLFPQATLVQVDRDPDAIGHTAPVDDAIVADARSAVLALLDALPAGRRTGLRTAARPRARRPFRPAGD